MLTVDGAGWGRGLGVAGAAAAVLVASGCGYDKRAYCSAVQAVSTPADLAEPDDAAVRAYLQQVRELEDLARGDDAERWGTLREGIESVMTDGRVDVAKVEGAQRRLTLMAQAADELEGRVQEECGVSLSGI